MEPLIAVGVLAGLSILIALFYSLVCIGRVLTAENAGWIGWVIVIAIHILPILILPVFYFGFMIWHRRYVVHKAGLESSWNWGVLEEQLRQAKAGGGKVDLSDSYQQYILKKRKAEATGCASMPPHL